MFSISNAFTAAVASPRIHREYTLDLPTCAGVHACTGSRANVGVNMCLANSVVQVGLPTEVLHPITARELKSLDPSAGTSGKLHSRAIKVTTKPQATCTLRQPLQRRTEYVFAATDASQHSAFLGE